jgi:hypothetical protein
MYDNFAPKRREQEMRASNKSASNISERERQEGVHVLRLGICLDYGRVMYCSL